MNNAPPVHIALFLTWDVSLDLWVQKGLFQREVAYYEQMAQSGVKITFFTWGGEEDIAHAKTLKNGIDVIPVYTRMARAKSKALRFLQSFYAPFVLRKDAAHADILKTNQMWGAWVAIICKFLCGKKLLLRSGFELYRFTILQEHSAPRRIFTWVLSKFCYAFADLIYVATEEDRNFALRTFSLPGKKIDVRPNWIDAGRFLPKDVPQKENHILFVGRLNAQKNLPLLIHAIAGQPWTLDIVGIGEMKDDLARIAQSSGAAVNFLGAIPNDELPCIYNAYPVYALVSAYEGNPKTLLEAMSCGRAVIGTDAEGIRSVIEDNKNGLLCRANASDIRAAITRLMDNPALRHELGAAARAKIVEKHSLEGLIARERMDYHGLLKTAMGHE